MAIVPTEIKYRLSGGAANSSPDASLGGVKSSVDVPVGIFDDVSSAEAGAGITDYRCVYVQNTNGTLTLIGAKLWIQAQTPSPGTEIFVGLGTSGLNATEQTIANETTAPTGVTFSSPASFAAGLTLGDVPAGQHFPVWIRRVVTAGAAAASDTFTLRVQGDTNP